MSRRLTLVALVAVALAAAVLPVARSAAQSGELGFDEPVFVTSGPEFQAAEPSIRVDSTEENRRIWITAPTGLGGTRLATGGSDIFWFSDDDGQTWTVATGPGGVGGPNIVGGGDSDVSVTAGDEVYGTGLTLANITLSASCDNGATFTSNPISNIGTVEDRQWIASYEDSPKPGPGPEFVLNYGGVADRLINFHQVASPACAPPVAGPRLITKHPECTEALLDPDCYQWPGTVAIDENSGDVYVTHNTLGNGEAPHEDAVVVSRIDGAAAGPVTQLDVHDVVVAADRPDTFDSFTVVEVDAAGNVYVVWTERHPAGPEGADGRTDTMLAVSQDRGETWTAPITVNSAPATTTFPWIVAGDAGKIDIAYYGTEATGPSPEEVPASSEWRVWMAQSLNALDADPDFAEVPATAPMHQGSVCTSGTGCDAGTRDLLDFFDIDVDERGLANITYTDNLNTPPEDDDPHQEWVTFVQQGSGPGIVGDAAQPTDAPTVDPSPTDKPSDEPSSGGGGGGGDRPTEEPTSTEEPTTDPTPTEDPGGSDDQTTRISGEERIATAAELSEASFPAGAGQVVLARADDFPDALASSTLAAEIGGPVLLTSSNGLDARTAEELRRLQADKVYLAGGTEALATQVEQEVEALGMSTERMPGADRFDTAGLIAREVAELGGPVDQAIVVRGDDFADALAAGNLATIGRAPILLTTTADLPDVTLDTLGDVMDGDQVFVAGGPAAVGEQPEEELRTAGYTAERRFGPDRYATAVVLLGEAVAQGMDRNPLMVASGTSFPDALAGVPAAHQRGGGLLLVDPEHLANSPSSRQYLDQHAAAIDDVTVVGGTNAVSQQVADQIADLIAG